MSQMSPTSLLTRRAPARPPAAPADEPARGAALFRTFLRLAAHWRLGKREQGVLLGGVSRHTLGRWAEAAVSGAGLTLERDQRDRIACLIAIHRSLRTIYPYDEIAYAWVSRPHGDFAGQAPLDVMLGGGLLDLVRVKGYLEDVLQGAG